MRGILAHFALHIDDVTRCLDASPGGLIPIGRPNDLLDICVYQLRPLHLRDGIHSLYSLVEILLHNHLSLDPLALLGELTDKFGMTLKPV